MEYTHLGRSGLSVSRLCLGTMNFGWKTEEADSHAIMDRALAEGINFFDTANVYGFDAGKGRTEEVLGSWFAQGGERREKTVLATKVYGGDVRLAQRHLPVRPQHRPRLRGVAAPDADRLDRPLPVPPRRPEDAVGGDLAGLRDPRRPGQGALRRLVATTPPGRSSRRTRRPARRNFQGLVSEQSHYNLLTRHVELEVLPAAQHYGVGIIPWSPLAGGLLGGVLRRPRAAAAATRACRSGWRSTGRRWSGTRTSAATSAPRPATSAWPGCCTSPRSPRRSSARARWSSSRAPCGPSTSTLDDAQLARLDEIFPGYKAAPMEYAW